MTGEDKIRIRKDMHKLRMSLSSPEALAYQIGTHAVDLIKNIKATSVALYAATRGEANTWHLASWLYSLGISVLYPRIVGRDLTFSENFTELKEGAFGILEPDSQAPVWDVNHIDVFVLPGLAFDYAGNRLGWGGGYYDRALSHTQATKVGLGFSVQVLDQIPQFQHDVSVDYVVTENGVAVCAKGKNST